ncbi:MAG: class Ib ribonucleoside-diphosphate reductase assembly flavoprotein NrdI [Bifidobacterium pullorum]
MVPTYGGGDLCSGRVPPAQVKRFLNDSRQPDRGSGRPSLSGNTNFGEACAAAGTDHRLPGRGVPLLYRFELMGMPGDADKVRQGVIDFLTKGNHS